MPRIISGLLLLCIAFTLTQCKSEDEIQLEKEREEMAKLIAESKSVSVYKGLKILIRSMPVSNGQENIDIKALKEAHADDNVIKAAKVKKISYGIVGRLFGLDTGQESMSILEGAVLTKEVYDLRNEIKNLNEDDFPTVLEVFSSYAGITGGNAADLPEKLKWNSTKEHMVIALVLDGAKSLPNKVKVYELSMIDTDHLDNNEFKPLAQIFQGLLLMEEEWYYLSEEALSKAINELDNNQIVLSNPEALPVIPTSKLPNEEAQLKQLHAIAAMLRGYARHHMESEDKNELAYTDFEQFVNDADQLGINNELSWLIGAIVYIKNEDTEKAKHFLDQLKKSDMLAEDEIEAIDEIKALIDKNKSDKALSTLSEKIRITKILSSHLLKYAANTEFFKGIAKTAAGKKLIELPVLIDKEYSKYGSYIEAAEKGSNLLDKVLN